MSTITGQNLPEPDRIFKKSFHHRNDSGELDVFEAARYFSGESAGGATTYTQKIMIRDERQSSDYWTRVGGGGGGGGGRRISLDMPSIKNHHHHHQLLFPSSHHHHHHAAADQKQINLKDKKYKQPSSPGGRLASFLNSLFSQSASKKKKSKPTAAAQDHDLDDSPGGRRKRRSSISHFGSTNSDHTLTTNIPNINKYSVSSKNSGFRTPPAVYAHTPTKNAYRSLSEAAVSSLKNPKISEKNNKSSETITATTVTNINKYSNSDRNVKKPIFDDVDDGADSDSSSDLFELQNYDLGDYSSGLPVYETTHMDTIKRGAPISVHGP